MIAFGLTVVFAAMFAGVAVGANARFRPYERLPMQWSIAGTVNWTAPRAIALGLVPALGTGLLTVVTLLDLTVGPRAGQEHMVLPVMVVMGMTFVAAQLLHFWLIDKTLKRNGS